MPAERFREWLQGSGYVIAAIGVAFAVTGRAAAGAMALIALGAVVLVASGAATLPRTESRYFRRVAAELEDWTVATDAAYRGNQPWRSGVAALDRLKPPRRFSERHRLLTRAMAQAMEADRTVDLPLAEQMARARRASVQASELARRTAAEATSDDEHDYAEAIAEVIRRDRDLYAENVAVVQQAAWEGTDAIAAIRPPRRLAERHGDLLDHMHRVAETLERFHHASLAADADAIDAAVAALENELDAIYTLARPGTE